MTGVSTSTSLDGRAQTRRGWWIGGALVLGLGLLVALATPWLLANRIEHRLTQRLGTDVVVDTVDVDVRGAGLVLDGIRLGEGSALEVSIDRLEVSWTWPSLLSADPPNIHVLRPYVRMKLDPQSLRKSKPPTPITLDGFYAFDVTDGHLLLEFEIDSEIIEIDFDEIEVRVTNTSLPSDDLTTQFTVRSKVGPSGTIEGSGSLIPSAPRSGWFVESTLRDLDIVPFNPLWRSVIEMDASQGRLNVDLRLALSQHRLRGHVVPRFDDLRLLGLGESARHPMGEALFSEMLSGADNPIEIDSATNTNSGPDFAELVEQSMRTIIGGMIQRGYQRQLSRLDGYKARIGAVDVDFAHTRLVLREISIERDTGLVESPFIYVDELDVTFDRTIIDPKVQSYKHVVIRRPTLTFVQHPDEARRQMSFDPQWPQKVSALPFQTANIIVEDGTIQLIEHRGSSTNEIAITDVHIDGKQMARDLSSPGERGASIIATGRALGAYDARIRSTYEPDSEEGNIRIELSLAPVPLTELNPLLRTHVGIDASAGQVGFEATVDSTATITRAEVVMLFEDLRFLGKAETIFEHPLRELLLAPRLKKLNGVPLRVEFERSPHSGLLSQVGFELLGEALSHR